MKRADVLPMPFMSAWYPRATASGSIDPLGALRPFTAVATTLLPGVTTITSRVRYLPWRHCQVNRFGAYSAPWPLPKLLIPR